MALVGGRMEAVAPKRSLFGPDYLLLAGLVLVSLGIHVWLVANTKVTARDSIGFARYALRIQSPESSNPDKPADARRLKIDVSREAEQPPGYPVAVWVAAKFVRRSTDLSLPESTLLATQIANAIAALLLVVPTYLIGRMLFSRSVGFSSALLFQVLPVPARITSDGLSEGVYLLAVATSLMLAVRAVRRPGVGGFLLTGLAIGASYLKNDADKTLLLSFNKTEGAGLYSLAYRVITPLYIPVRALADSTFARFFREGHQSAVDTYKLARRTTVIGAGFALLGGLAIVACAPLLPWLLGEKWEPAVLVTRWLAFVPFLVSLQMYGYNALMGLGRQKACLLVNGGASVLNISLNILLIPRYDWRGSTAATIVSEVLSVAAVWLLLSREARVRGPMQERLNAL